MPVVLATELKKLFIKSDVKGCMTQSFFSAHHSLFVCHSSGPQIEGFGEQCKISTVSTQPTHNTTQNRTMQQRCSDRPSALGIYCKASVSRPWRWLCKKITLTGGSYLTCTAAVFLFISCTVADFVYNYNVIKKEKGNVVIPDLIQSYLKET